MKKLLTIGTAALVAGSAIAADLVVGMGEVNVTIAEADVPAFGAWLNAQKSYTNRVEVTERVRNGVTNSVSRNVREVVVETNEDKLKRVLRAQVERTLSAGIQRYRPKVAKPVIVVENPE